MSSSALYLDEQPITQSGRKPDPRFIDIERIEALRGPQGTLYGASSQSGTLRVITNKPDPSGFDAWAEAQVADTRSGGVSHDLSAMVNLPLVADQLSLRLVGFTSEDAGFIDNVLGDSPGGTFDNANVVDKDVNKIKTSGGRAALRWDVTDSVDVDARRAVPGCARRRPWRHEPWTRATSSRCASKTRASTTSGISWR